MIIWEIKKKKKIIYSNLFYIAFYKYFLLFFRYFYIIDAYSDMHLKNINFHWKKKKKKAIIAE